MGITNITVVTLDNLTRIGNITSPSDFFVNINVYFGGILYYSLFWIAAVIMIAGLHERNPEARLLDHASVVFGVITVITLFALFLQWVSAYQWGSFLILSLVLASASYYTKEK